MKFPELGKKIRAHGVFNADQPQSGSEALAYFRHYRGQFAPLVERSFRFDAPDQQVHGVEGVLPHLAVLAIDDVNHQ